MNIFVAEKVSHLASSTNPQIVLPIKALSIRSIVAPNGLRHKDKPGRQCDRSTNRHVEVRPRSHEDTAAALCWLREYEEVLDKEDSTAEPVAKVKKGYGCAMPPYKDGLYVELGLRISHAHPCHLPASESANLETWSCS